MITVPNGRIDTFEGHINFWSPESWNIFIRGNVSEKEFDIETGLLDISTNFTIVKRKNCANLLKATFSLP